MTPLKRPPWFGRILRWSPNPHGHATNYLGREHEITKVGRERAQAYGRGCSLGWHFTVHPDAHDIDPDERNPIGPALGGRLDHARLLAEAWILTPEPEHRSADGSPSLVDALGGGGPGFRAQSGVTLVAYPDHDSRRVKICHQSPHNHPRTGAVVGTVRVTFTTDAEDGAVSLTWTPTLANGADLGTYSGWHDACRAIGATV
ncbi:hypothetical protein [Actinocrispum wychmicini]|uniref:Uncharacterized protein n=1 Tax=Actinocrispum wychmicini TaxID=1213861 RepID=A0A4R2JFY1_9PSEU|nr:hypothetical protein [Actinocrispum wychmicini]TCO57162.1 hypothetical protein EV192_106639 [Actinocrispum wychmicini]